MCVERQAQILRQGAGPPVRNDIAEKKCGLASQRAGISPADFTATDKRYLHEKPQILPINNEGVS
jgi:hypothetical protein